MYKNRRRGDGREESEIAPARPPERRIDHHLHQTSGVPEEPFYQLCPAKVRQKGAYRYLKQRQAPNRQLCRGREGPQKRQGLPQTGALSARRLLKLWRQPCQLWPDRQI
ncbi:hypothetical protein D1872_274980 [compost metagenome]